MRKNKQNIFSVVIYSLSKCGKLKSLFYVIETTGENASCCNLKSTTKSTVAGGWGPLFKTVEYFNLFLVIFSKFLRKEETLKRHKGNFVF